MMLFCVLKVRSFFGSFLGDVNGGIARLTTERGHLDAFEVKNHDCCYNKLQVVISYVCPFYKLQARSTR